MRKSIYSSAIKGIVCAPSSKSAMIRAVALALLAYGTTTIKNPSNCDDALTAMDMAETLGARIKKESEVITIEGNPVLKERPIKDTFLHCGESGLCMRMFAPIAGLLNKEMVLQGEGTLSLRPMKMVEELVKLGALCSTDKGLPPITVRGPISSGNYRLNGALSSQFLTGVIMALPLCNGDSEIYVEDLKSKPYLKMTIEMMGDFGVDCEFNDTFDRFFIKGNQAYKGKELEIEGDWSGAAFMLVAGAIGGEITVKGLNTHSTQADKVILDALKMAGAEVETKGDMVTVKKNNLRAFSFNAEDSPDIVPPLAALAAHCNGKTFIAGIKRLSIKESNRLEALIKEFSKMGINIYIEKERLVIEGGRGNIKNEVVHSHNDHRIAMACAICGLSGKTGVTIEDAQCVSKSYPLFFEDLSLCMEEK